MIRYAKRLWQDIDKKESKRPILLIIKFLDINFNFPAEKVTSPFEQVLQWREKWLITL